MTMGARTVIHSSTRPAAASERARPRPPSQRTCMKPRRPSSRTASAASRNTSVRSFAASVNSCALRGSLPLRDTTVRQRSSLRRVWQRSEGLSLRTVSAPTMTTSTLSRIFPVNRRDRSLEIQRAFPKSSQILPSSDIASFTVTNGRPVVTCFANGRISGAASSAQSPHEVAMPARRSVRAALPRFAGFGSAHAHTTRFTPAAINASQHAPTRPGLEHGSNVTYTVAPAGEPLHALSAATSAWSRPQRRWRPSPITLPPFTTTAPTGGFGRV